VLKGHKKGIWSVEFSPVDQCVITASGDKTMRIWAISDGSCLKIFTGHVSSVLRASFLTRGTQCVSCGNLAESYLFGFIYCSDDIYNQLNICLQMLMVW
jgi:WD40 repeat protein